MHCWGRAESWAGERGTSLHLPNPLQADMLGHCHHTRWCPIGITLIVIFLQHKAVIAWGIVVSWKRGSVWDLENITQSIWGSLYITHKSKQLLTLRWLQATSSQDASCMQMHLDSNTKAINQPHAGHRHLSLHMAWILKRQQSPSIPVLHPHTVRTLWPRSTSTALELPLSRTAQPTHLSPRTQNSPQHPDHPAALDIPLPTPWPWPSHLG